MIPTTGPILVDTSILHEMAEGSRKGLLAEGLLQGMRPSTCLHTVGEAIVCVHRNLPRNRSFPRRLMKLVRRWDWLDYPRESPQIYAAVVESYTRNNGKKAKCNASDFWILTCAIANNVPLLTADAGLVDWSMKMRHPVLYIYNPVGLQIPDPGK